MTKKQNKKEQKQPTHPYKHKHNQRRNSPPLCVRCGEGTLGGEGDNPTPPAVAAKRAAAGPAVLPDAEAEEVVVVEALEEEEEEEEEVAVGASEEEWVASVVGNIDNDGDGVGAWRVEPERAAPATVGRAKMDAVKAADPVVLRGRSRHEFVSIRGRSTSDEKIFMTRTVCRTIVL